MILQPPKISADLNFTSPFILPLRKQKRMNKIIYFVSFVNNNEGNTYEIILQQRILPSDKVCTLFFRLGKNQGVIRTELICSQ